MHTEDFDSVVPELASLPEDAELDELFDGSAAAAAAAFTFIAFFAGSVAAFAFFAGPAAAFAFFEGFRPEAFRTEALRFLPASPPSSSNLSFRFFSTSPKGSLNNLKYVPSPQKCGTSRPSSSLLRSAIK